MKSPSRQLRPHTLPLRKRSNQSESLSSCHGKESSGSVQRRSAGDHYHDHGAGVESPPRHRSGCAQAVAAGLSELRSELHLCRHLLEQSSSHVADREESQRRHSLGELAPFVLALPLPFHYRLDGRESLRFI